MAVADYDGDGRLDLYLLNNGGPRGRPNQLFQQQPDGTFRNVSKGSGLDISGHCMGVAIGDVNNDGFADVLVTEFGGVHLFLNNGNGTFTDVTKQAGVGLGDRVCVAASFADYDNSGHQSLFVTSTRGGNVLFKNLGNGIF